jgi:hypothetical protein
MQRYAWQLCCLVLLNMGIAILPQAFEAVVRAGSLPAYEVLTVW